MMDTSKRHYIGGWFHVKERMYDRFDVEINLVQFYKKYVVVKKNRKKSKSKYTLVRDGEMVFVYIEVGKYKYPITVYKINRDRKGYIVKKHRGLVNLAQYMKEDV